MLLRQNALACHFFILYRLIGQDSGFSADFADEAEIVYAGTSDMVSGLFLLQQSLRKLVMPLGKSLV